MPERFSMGSCRLGLRSAYSLLWGTVTVERLFSALAEKDVDTVAITDRNGLYGFPACREAAKETGISLVTGAELLSPSGSVFAFVQDMDGYARLCDLLGRIGKDRAFDCLPALQADAGGLILAGTSVPVLDALAGSEARLYAAITPRSLSAVPAARRLRLPLIALDDATFLEESEREVHAVLRAMATGKTVGTLGPGDMEGPGGLLLDEPAYQDAFSCWPEAVEATEEVARTCIHDPFPGKLLFPGYRTEGQSVGEELRRRVIEGAETRYGELSDGILDRIGYELDIIEKKGFAAYFLVMHDIVSMSGRTCGRGSAAASIVSYSLGITDVDPIAYNLYFERFLSMARLDPPDIDVDFAWDERPGLFRSVFERFGADHCARVANHNRFGLRSALRDTARSYGLPDSTIARMEQVLLSDGPGKVSDPLWHTVFSIAQRLVGLPKGLSMHCGGIVITEDPVSRHAPVGVSADGFPLLAWEKEGTEAAGFVKIDLLGNRSLAVIRDALANLGEEGIEIDERTWRPAEDPAVVAALARGDSMGVFYIESPAMRQLQKKTGKGDFDHIVIHSSLIRPAANRYIAEYVERLKGKKWNPLHPRLAYILDETYGIMCYQEDVSKTAMALAGFDETDADALRKVIAKKAGGARLARYEQRFFEGCRRNEIPDPVVREVWSMMLSFDGYSFCKPHSASYAMVSFRSAYLRVHYPAAFMAAVLTNGGGYYRPHAYVSEARRMGIQVIGPDINRSRVAYHAVGNRLVVGFMAIRNLTGPAMRQIVEERARGGQFLSLQEVSSRLSISRDDFVSLVAAGTFDSVAEGMARSEQLRQLLVTMRKTEPSGQGELFAPLRLPSVRKRTVRAVRTRAELHREYEALGFLRDSHPLSLWADALSRLVRVRARDLQQWIGRSVTLVGWQVTGKEVLTKDGKSMSFVSFEDETALYETVLFPRVFARYRSMLQMQWPLQIEGVVQDDQGALNVQILCIKPVKSG
jgi:DNA polymerase-3 subunit alpha/error-prone DNA polymerase